MNDPLDPTIVPQSEEHRQSIERVRERRAQLAEDLLVEFPEPITITLEIGSGHGHYLTAYALEHPEEHCVGIDLITKRVQKGTAKRDKREMENLRFLKAEAMEFIGALPEHVTLGKVFLLFPDPWPKDKHHKRRLVQKPFLDLLAEKSAPGTHFCYRTDHENYFEWTTERVTDHSAWVIHPEIEWPFEHGSYFQNLMDSYQSFIAVRQPEA